MEGAVGEEEVEADEGEVRGRFWVVSVLVIVKPGVHAESGVDL